MRLLGGGFVVAGVGYVLDPTQRMGLLLHYSRRNRRFWNDEHVGDVRKRWPVLAAALGVSCLVFGLYVAIVLPQ